MKQRVFQHVYGPVPSRRLGRSLGIDLVPFKTCTYDCVYCQLGRTTHKTLERKTYVSTQAIMDELRAKLAEDPAPSYLSIAGSGEPTLQLELGDLLQQIKALTPIPVAVFTNGSLLSRPEVRTALLTADLVLPSLDAATEAQFQRVNRPHVAVSYDTMLAGLATFIQQFQGPVWLEVFLLKGSTGLLLEAQRIAALIRQLRPARVQLNTVSRPPAEHDACPVPLHELQALKELFPGEVDIISEVAPLQPSIHPLPSSTTEVLALLDRRPCTADDVAAGLGIHRVEALKQLETLSKLAAVRTYTTEGKRYYQSRAHVP